MQINPDQLLAEFGLLAFEARVKDRHIEDQDRVITDLRQQIADLSAPVIPDPPEGGANADDPGRPAES